MRAIKARNTVPEIAVRRLVHSMGYRFRLHGTQLPGKPDLVFPGKRRVIFVHGCYWHRHTCTRGRSLPRTNREFWLTKLTRNVQRDSEQLRLLKKVGWKVLVVWECELRNTTKITARLRKFLG